MAKEHHVATKHEPKARGLTKAERDLLLEIARITCLGNPDLKDKMAAVVAECPDETAEKTAETAEKKYPGDEG